MATVEIKLSRNAGTINIPSERPDAIPDKLSLNLNRIGIAELKRIMDLWNIGRSKVKKIADLRRRIIENFEDAEPMEIVEPRAIPPSGKLRILDLCSGCGGIAEGFRLTEKYQHVGMMDNDKNCCATLIENGFDESLVECFDITKVDFSDLKYTCDIIVIGSPCQSFSHSGKKEGFADPRGQVLLGFIDILDTMDPPMFLIENVRGLMSHEKGESLKRLLKELTDRGYFVKYELLDASRYCVPQKRERVFIFGSKLNNNFAFPEPSNDIVTLGDAIADLEDDDANEVEQIYNEKKLPYFEKIPPGGCWVDLCEEDQKAYLGKSFYSGGGRRGILKKLSYDKPSPTILCSPQQKQTERCHPTKNRPLTIRESARIQTFPDSYMFTGSIASQYKQIGNAVPVRLARTMAESIYSYWHESLLAIH